MGDDAPVTPRLAPPVLARLASLALGLPLTLGACSSPEPTAGPPSSREAPPEPTRSATQAVDAPCTAMLQGIGAVGAGWAGLRTDGSVFETSPFFPGTPAERLTALGTDNVALADMDGESLHYCVIKSDGSLRCWGNNTNGQLGLGCPTAQCLEAHEVMGLPGPVAEVAVSDRNTCARIETDGSVWCWGDNEFGQLGDGTYVSSDVPVEVTALGTGVDQLSLGFWHACALKNGDVYCWGDNLYGAIGNGASASVGNVPYVPTPVAVMQNARYLSAGGFFTCAIRDDDTLFCWGDNYSGHCGLGDRVDRVVPTEVTTLGSDVLTVDTGVRHGCALKNDGSAWCWGWQGDGRVGNGTNAFGDDDNELLPVPVSGPLGTGGATKLWVTEGAACVLRTDGGLSCWGGGGFLDGGGLATTPVDVDFCGLPTLDAVDPPFGGIMGGDVITLTGTELLPGSTVFFENLEATNVTWIDESTLEVVSPNLGYGDLVDVRVVGPTGAVARLDDAYLYSIPPSIYGVVPGRGSTLGGDVVQVQGGYLTAQVEVFFDGQPATGLSWIDGNAVDVTVPAHAPGFVDVLVRNPDGQEDLLAMGFEYVAPPSVTSLDPDRGPTAGGTDVTISGAGFDYTVLVEFDGVPATTTTFLDAETIIAEAPPHAEGAVDVRVHREDGAETVAPGAFVYTDELTGGAGGGAQGGGGNASGGIPPGCDCALVRGEAGSGSQPSGLALGLAGLALAAMRRARRARR